MPISFYEASAETYSRMLDAMAGVLNKGVKQAEDAGVDLQELVMTRLREDMMPFHFQIVSVAHHSLGAMQALQSGEFSPPSFELDKDYAGLQGLIDEARKGMAAYSPEEVEALADKTLTFKLGDNKIPFTNQNFLLSFSLPNFYFHAATAYDILRMKGISLGKRDFLGAMKAGV